MISHIIQLSTPADHFVPDMLPPYLITTYKICESFILGLYTVVLVYLSFGNDQ